MTDIATMDPLVYDVGYRYVRFPHALRALPANTPAPSTAPPGGVCPVGGSGGLESLLPPRGIVPLYEEKLEMPQHVVFTPHTVELHPSWAQTAIGAAMQDNILILSAVTPEMLAGLSRIDLSVLLHTLAGVDVTVEWRNSQGFVASGSSWGPLAWRRNTCSNAAGALALSMASMGDLTALSVVLGACPGASVELFSGKLRPFLRLDVVANAIRNIMTTVASQPENPCADRLNAADRGGRLIELFLQQHASKDDAEIESAIWQLLEKLLTPPPNMEDPLTPARLGVMFGVVFAGAFKHVYTIKASDETRHRAINSALVLGRVALAFLPYPIGAGAQLGVQTAQTAFDYADVPRNFTQALARFQGEFELEALGRPVFSDQEKTDKMLHFVHAVQLANGYRA